MRGVVCEARERGGDAWARVGKRGDLWERVRERGCRERGRVWVGVRV